MAHRSLCSSMGAFRRSLSRETPIASKSTARLFQNSARRADEQPSGDAPSPAPAPQTRKDRSVAALRQLTSLQNRKIIPGALAKGSFRSGQTGSSAVNEDGFLPENYEPQPTGSSNTSDSSFVRYQPNPQRRGPAPPPGQMIRAPTTLRITRNAVGGGRRDGPNLQGRTGGPGGNDRRRGRQSNNSTQGPKKRERKQDSNTTAQHTPVGDVDPAITLSDTMVLQLLRLQRKEWDRVPYEPKYAPGSLAANELIHEGRELFKGESPRVKIWGPLERRIGVVGMYGAEATLKIRRVEDGTAEPFGQEIMEMGETETVSSPESVETGVVA